MSRRNSEPNIAPSVTVENPNYSSVILQKLNEHRLRKAFTDVTLIADGEEFPCHRNILAASSEYFHALFSGDFKEKSENCIKFEEVSAKTLQAVIDYAYTGSLDVNIDNAQDLLAAGSLFQYPEVLETSCEFLRSHLHPCNCLGFEQYAHLHCCERLESDAHQCALENFSVVASYEEFLEIPMERLVSYLASDLIDVRSEECVFKAAYKWVYHDPKKRQQYACGINSHLRFGTMDANFVSETVMNEPLISSCSDCKQLVSSQLTSINGCLDKNTDDICHIPRMSTVAREVLVVLGGITDTNEITRSVEMFDDAKGKWMTLPELPQAVTWFSVATIKNYIYVIGGIIERSIVNKMWCFSPTSFEWTSAPTLVTPRARHSSTGHQGRIFTLGGISMDKTTDERIHFLSTIECFDPTNGQCTIVGECPFPRKQSRVVSYSNKLVEVGGVQHEHCVKHDIMECFLVSEGNQVTLSEQFRLQQSLHFAQISIIDNVFYIVDEDKRTMFMLNPTKRTSRNMPSPTSAHIHSGAGVLNGNFYLTGGVANSKPTRSVECYNPKFSLWNTVKSMSVARAFHGCVTVSLP